MTALAKSRRQLPPPHRQRASTPFAVTSCTMSQLIAPGGLPDTSPINSNGGFNGCIDGLSSWLMRSAREIGRGTSVQALRERRACQERVDAQQAALPVQRLRPELHRHASTRQIAGPEGGGRAALRQW